MEKETKNPIENPTQETVEEIVEETNDDLEDSKEEIFKKDNEDQGEGSLEESTKETIKDTEEQINEETIDESKEKQGENHEKEAVREEEYQEKIEEDPTKNLIKEFIKKHKKVVIGIAIFLCTLLIIYLGMTQYFTSRFHYNTEVNGIDVSGDTIDEVKEVMATQLQTYTLILIERDGKQEQITASDIGLEYTSDEKLKELKDGQDPFKWILSIFNKNKDEMIVGYTYDEKMLKKSIDDLKCFDSSNLIEPKNPSFKYVDNKYVIVDEVPGNEVDKDSLYTHVVDSILNAETEIDLDALDCYVKPKFNSKSKEVIETSNILNKYISSKITYTFGNDKETLDGSIINKWVRINDNFEVTLDEERVKDFVNQLSKKYNTVGRLRNFITSSGRTIKVGGGDYGWSINKTKETESLISAIIEGKTITKEPVYSQAAFARGNNDIGNTYVEIDLSRQHIWFYKGGSLIVHGDIVTGNVSQNHTTPKGVYRLKYKAKDVVLRGDDYAVPVTFWMPFNGGIGIHDASWRSVFGGNIYKTNGSHGCINSPYNVAEAIYKNITPNTPVVCY